MKRKLSVLILTIIFLFSFSTQVFADNADLPNIYGKSAIVVDVETGEIIYAKNVDTSPMYPASTTKLLTALLLAENKKPNDMLTYTKNAYIQPQYSLYNLVKRSNLKVGDTMTADDTMKALLLYSANDLAYMIADNVAGNPANFANMMNEKIKKMGLKNTHFVTPNGIDNNINNHYTSAYDLSIITREAFKNPWVKKVMNTKNDRVEVSNGAIAIVKNRNKLLGQKIDTSFADKIGINLEQVPASNAVCIGGKTGYTSKAGKCLSAIFDKDGRILVGVVLNSVYDNKDTYVFNDMAKIINWSYAAKKTSLYKANKELKTVKLKYKPFKFFGPEKEIQVPVSLKEDASYYNNEVNKSEIKTEIQISDIKMNKLNKDTSIGKLVLKERDATKTYDLYPTLSSKDVMKANVFLYALCGFVAIIVVLVVLAIIRLILNISRRRNRRGRKYF